MKQYANKKEIKYVRWMGAYGKGGNLISALRHELRFEGTVACESFRQWSRVPGKVGLLCDRKAFIRGFQHDCWSYEMKDGRLANRRQNPHSPHNELWVRGNRKFKAVVVTSLDLRKFAEIKEFCVEQNLPLLLLKKGLLLEVNMG